MAAVRIALVAGEASGDLLGSRVIAALRAHLPDAEFVGIGGPKMIGAGLDAWFPQERLAVRGLFEVLGHLREILAIRRALVRRLKALRPDLYIGVDAPDFNLPVEKKLKRAGITTAHLVSPTVWAWRRGRIDTIRAAVNHMLVLFPFEEPIYREAGIAVTFVGHPLADEIPPHCDRTAAREQLRVPVAGRIVAVLPGSRQSEIRMMAPCFIRTARLILERLPEARFLVPLVTRETRTLFEEELYREQALDLPVTMLFGHAHEAMAAADVVLAASGTVTLEAALLRRPMVIAYRLAPLTYAIARRVIRVDHIGLPNLLAGQFLVPEFIQDEATPENLAQALVNLAQDAPVIRALEERFDGIHAMLRRDAANQAAVALLPYLARAAGRTD